MGEEEKHKRRATEFPESESKMTKKQAVLGDITNVDRKIVRKKTPKTAMHECNQPSSCSIYHHLRALEVKANRNRNRSASSSSSWIVEKEVVSNKTRAILVDWLVEVVEEFKLTSDTLYNAVSLIDRFLSIRPITINQLQLLGASSMLIASKHDDIFSPQVEQFCYMTDNAYTVSEIIQMEKEILSSLKCGDYPLHPPTSKTFLRIFVRAAEKSFKDPMQKLELLASYLLELSLLDSRCTELLPSLSASSALFLSKFMIQPDHHPWNKELQCQTGYKPCDMKECVFAIHALHLHYSMAVSPLKGVREKYLQDKFKCVASLTVGEIPTSYFQPIAE